MFTFSFFLNFLSFSLFSHFSLLFYVFFTFFHFNCFTLFSLFYTFLPFISLFFLLFSLLSPFFIFFHLLFIFFYCVLSSFCARRALLAGPRFNERYSWIPSISSCSVHFTHQICKKRKKPNVFFVEKRIFFCKSLKNSKLL